MSFKKSQLIQTFRMREEEVISEMRDLKQGLTWCLTEESDKAFAFLYNLNM